MHRIIMILTLALSLQTARATALTDLTPGGVQNLSYQMIQLLNRATFYDSAAHGFFDPGHQYLNGWISQYGAINGGVFFNTNLFAIGDSTSAQLTWNFTGAPGGAWLTYVYVFGRRTDGTAVENLYTTNTNNIGQDTVALDGLATIIQIGFYGFDPTTVPDTGDTLLLFGLALIGLTIKKYGNRH